MEGTAESGCVVTGGGSLLGQKAPCFSWDHWEVRFGPERTQEDPIGEHDSPLGASPSSLQA